MSASTRRQAAPSTGSFVTVTEFPWLIPCVIWALRHQHYHTDLEAAGAALELVTKRMAHSLFAALFRQCHDVLRRPDAEPGLSLGTLAVLSVPWRVYDYPFLTRFHIPDTLVQMLRSAAPPLVAVATAPRTQALFEDSVTEERQDSSAWVCPRPVPPPPPPPCRSCGQAGPGLSFGNQICFWCSGGRGRD